MKAVWENRRSAGADAIFALVAGYQTGIREAKPLAFLQAFIDDSASESGDKRLFLAGYLNNAENWAKFADAWQDELRAGNAIRFLHMVDANNFSGEFKGWTDDEKNEKLRGLMRVARHFKPFSFHVSVSRAEYFDTVKRVAPRGLGSPHLVCCVAVVSNITRYLAQQGWQHKVKFIFDKQNGVEDDIALFFDHMKTHIPREARKLIYGQPSFEDDKTFTPLQAADMLAWHLRRNHEYNGSWSKGDPGASLCNPKGHLSAELDSMLPSWTDEFSKMPAIERMQTKPEWRKLKVALRQAKASGYIPPHGTRFKNFKHRIRDRVAAIIRRLRGRR
jgi:hypothetical protein